MTPKAPGKDRRCYICDELIGDCESVMDITGWAHSDCVFNVEDNLPLFKRVWRWITRGAK